MKENMSKLYFDILSSAQQEALRILRRFGKNRTWAGGTALAVQLGHRKSYDIDIFQDKPIAKNFIFHVTKSFGNIQKIVDSADELSFVSGEGVKISFVFFPFEDIFKMVDTRYLGMSSWKDIALNKAYAIGRRGEWRDYVDLFFCLRAGFSLQHIVQRAKKKFKDAFSEKLFLSQLCYFGDIKDYSIEFFAKQITQKEIQELFKRETRRMKLV